MNIPTKLVLFAGLCLLYIGFPFYMVQRKKRVVDEGQPFVFYTNLSEPQVSYRGPYLGLQVSEEINTAAEVRKGQRVYAILEQESGGTKITNIQKKRPQSSNYVRARVRYVENDLVFLDYPPALEYVHLTTEEARRLSNRYERFLKDPARAAGEVPVQVHVFKGRAVGTGLLPANRDR